MPFPGPVLMNHCMTVGLTHPVDGEERTAEFWDERDAEKKSRESVVDTDSTGFQETKQVEGFPFAKSGADRWQRNPRESPPPEPRPTTGMSPHTYRFWRPFGTLDEKGNTPHRFTGLHFSMADHRRNYTILGTTPARHPGASTRNTYRLPPTPWDQNIVDLRRLYGRRVVRHGPDANIDSRRCDNHR
jgi:hypothetical protein